MTPLAMKVVATGMFSFSAKSTSAADAPARTTPFPAMMSGRWAWEMSSAVCITFSGGGDGCMAACERSGRSSSISMPAMLSGSSMKLAPGFSAWAALKALRTTSGMTSGARTLAPNLVMGSTMRTRSTTWWLSLCRRVVGAWPAIATRGAPSMLASAMPVTRLVAPGPKVERQTPARPVSRPQTSAMKAAPCSCRVVTNSMLLLRRASITSRFSSPGMPQTWSLLRSPSTARKARPGLGRSSLPSFLRPGPWFS